MKFRRRTGGKRIHTDRHITHSRVFTHNKRTPEEREVLVVKVDRPVLKINLATKRRKKIKRKKKKKKGTIHLGRLLRKT